MIVGFIGKALRGKIGRENFDKLLAINQIHHICPRQIVALYGTYVAMQSI